MVRPPFTPQGIKRGAAVAYPLTFGVLIYGIGFGLLAVQSGMTSWQATLLSVFVYSASAQLAMTGILAAGFGSLAALLWAVIALILVINARYLLLGASLRPWLGSLPARQIYPTLFILGDGNWMLSMRAYENGERDAGFVLGASIAPSLAWCLGTLIGAVAGGFAPDPKQLGLDFLLASLAASMLAGLVKERRDARVLIVATITAIGLVKIGLTNWAPVVAGIAAGCVAFFREVRAGNAQ